MIHDQCADWCVDYLPHRNNSVAQGEKQQGSHMSLSERWDLSKVLKVTDREGV